MLALSLALHLVFLFFAAQMALFRQDISVADAIYVDVVNMPVESPQAGSPVGAAHETAAAPVPAPPPPSPPEMKAPKTKAASGPKLPTIPPKTAKAETAREYDERLAALERATEARHAQAALADIAARAAGKGAAAGMPGAAGTQAGSDYGAFIQSRLKDAFEVTIAWQTKNPHLVVRLFIDGRGGLIRYKIEKSTGDTIFEDAVDRAIQLARKKFPAPPGGKEFSTGFVFKPQGVEKR